MMYENYMKVAAFDNYIKNVLNMQEHSCNVALKMHHYEICMIIHLM